MPEVTPDWKPARGAKQPTRRGRPRTTAAEWRKLHAMKGAPCRLCGTTRYELHHVLSRARGGPDAPWNLVPLCKKHHLLVTREDRSALQALAGRLTDDEYAGLVQQEGEQVFERLFGIEAAR